MTDWRKRFREEDEQLAKEIGCAVGDLQWSYYTNDGSEANKLTFEERVAIAERWDALMEDFCAND